MQTDPNEPIIYLFLLNYNLCNYNLTIEGSEAPIQDRKLVSNFFFVKCTEKGFTHKLAYP